MKKRIILLFCIPLIISACKEKLNKREPVVNYPKTAKIPVIDTYFNTEIIDNYRWLEDDNSKETGEWVQYLKDGSLFLKVPF